MKYGILRAACVSPSLKVCDTEYNSEKIISLVKEADKKNISFLVFPELSITGYTCADLFMQKSLQKSALNALKKICLETQQTDILFVVGLPFEMENRRYNCAAFIQHGNILALVPKYYIPNYNEFYERRWFSSYDSDTVLAVSLGLDLEHDTVPFGTRILISDINDSRLKIACEICEDAWVPLSPSTYHALSGATVIANLSASNEIVGKAEYRRMLVSSLSAKQISAYIYCNAGHDESTQDMIFSGHSLICQNGTILSESEPFTKTDKFTICDIDLEKLEQDRLRSTTFAQCADRLNIYEKKSFYTDVAIKFKPNIYESNIAFSKKEYLAPLSPKPFVPLSKTERKERCSAIIEMQSEGLAKRLRHINCNSAVIGLSGGLDSTLALLVTCRAFDKCNISREKITAITMPCFGTTDRTYKNACVLAKNTGTTLKEIIIKDAVNLHFKNIGHDPSVHDVTYENCQARERTQILMDYANKTNGIVIGTGDLSELALGWCTYNGDQMSMYGVNSSIPKTLVRYLVTAFAEEALKEKNKILSDVLTDILATPVSPELIPPDKNGRISQKTEDLIGPYELHDFFLYYVLRFGFEPEKIYFLAKKAFLGKKAEGTDIIYTEEIILKWLKNFYKRFFSQQFKRSCMPDGAKVGTVNLSPRGDWRMPSDASAAIWLKEIETITL